MSWQVKDSEGLFYGNYTGGSINLNVNSDLNISAVLGASIETLVNGQGQIKLIPESGPYAFGSRVKIIPLPRRAITLERGVVRHLVMRRDPLSTK